MAVFSWSDRRVIITPAKAVIHSANRSIPRFQISDHGGIPNGETKKPSTTSAEQAMAAKRICRVLL